MVKFMTSNPFSEFLTKILAGLHPNALDCHPSSALAPALGSSPSKAFKSQLASLSWSRALTSACLGTGVPPQRNPAGTNQPF